MDAGGAARAARRAKGLGWVGTVGPGVIVLGVSIGGGEFLLGPAAFVQYGLSLLRVTVVSVFFQTLFNMELMRYTVATGEPVFTGFMRTGPSSKAWAWFYAALYFLQTGWPASAGVAAGAMFFLWTRRLPAPDDSAAVYRIGAGAFIACVAVLLAGRRIERTLEVLNWILDAIHERIVRLNGYRPGTNQTLEELVRRARLGV